MDREVPKKIEKAVGNKVEKQSKKKSAAGGHEGKVKGGFILKGGHYKGEALWAISTWWEIRKGKRGKGLAGLGKKREPLGFVAATLWKY